MKDPIAEIESYLDRLTAGLPLPANLIAAIRYSLLGGGKRLRPLLAWRCCEAAGGLGSSSLPGGAAVELIHAFSLVHDDLPAMDDDDLRRGKPTLHIHAGEALAILAGDAMMAIAFEHLVTHVKEPALADGLVRELSQATSGMIAGQVYDSLGGFPAGLSDRERLVLIHRNKTGALIRAACRMGGMSGSARTESLDAITRYAECVGLMFQIVDDLLDIEATPEQTGKRTRKDAKAGKLTFPGLLGVPESKAEVQRLTREAADAVGVLGPPAQPLVALAERMSQRTH